MIDEIIKDAEDRMGKSVESFRSDLTKIRTGRAHPSLLDHITVEYYGAATPLSQVANVSVEDARTLSITPWEKDMVKAIEKAIMKSDLGLTPSSDGKLIRLAIPPLTEERRKELVKVVASTCEDYKIGVRNIRRDSNDMIKSLKKDGDISEDEAFKAQDQVQKITDEHIEKIDEVFKEKEKEILEF